MHYKTLLGKPYLGAEDLPEGQDVKLTIEDVLREEAFNPGSKKNVMVGVLKFVNKDLKMILNVTNSKEVAKIYGPEVNGWKGKEIILYRTTTKLGGKMVPCLRIKIEVKG